MREDWAGVTLLVVVMAALVAAVMLWAQQL